MGQLELGMIREALDVIACVNLGMRINIFSWQRAGRDGVAEYSHQCCMS